MSLEAADDLDRRLAGHSGASTAFESWEIDLHGHRVIYRLAGSGPAVLLIHGMVNASRHWERVARRLAADYTVIAPDLLGHGDSAKPEGDYSLGAHAAGIRDLLSALGLDHVTVVGHSLGGGIAMQFFYQFPERCERMVLISSGGLGREVSRPLRLAAVPGADPALKLAASTPVISTLEALGAKPAARALQSLHEPGARRAFLHTLRSVIGPAGQRVSARDRLELTAALPTMIVWGDRDRTIPPDHGRSSAEQVPWIRLELLPGVGHFPHLQAPDALADVLLDFLQTTEPARPDAATWRRMLQGATPRRRG